MTGAEAFRFLRKYGCWQATRNCHTIPPLGPENSHALEYMVQREKICNPFKVIGFVG
jgi:hypothetical protein